MSGVWDHDLAVLDVGEIIDEETMELVASFVPTDEAVEAWEDRVAVINDYAREQRELLARASRAV